MKQAKDVINQYLELAEILNTSSVSIIFEQSWRSGCRSDITARQILHKRGFSMFIDADIYDIYNRENTFYFKKIWNEEEKRYFYRNIPLFRIMPSLTIRINLRKEYYE